MVSRIQVSMIRHSPSYTSKHLKVLEHSGAVRQRIAGTHLHGYAPRSDVISR